MYKVSEIFHTIQGEGLHAGKPCVFLRFSGCNLWRSPETPSVTCPWCDTPQLHNSALYTREAILSSVDYVRASDKCGLVITGGEPFLQLDTELLQELCAVFPWIDIETNGSVTPKVSSDFFEYHAGRVFISCSPKLPKLSQIVVKPDWFKILIPAKKMLLSQLVEEGVDHNKVYLQPVEPLDEGGSLDSPTYQHNIRECVDLAFLYGFSVSLQLHKYLSLQ